MKIKTRMDVWRQLVIHFIGAVLVGLFSWLGDNDQAPTLAFGYFMGGVAIIWTAWSNRERPEAVR